ncbi:MAG: dihydropteroate synthase [Phycisphaerales bacterium]
MTPLRWSLANGRTLTLDRPHLMGIVNVTPDSFSDGGHHATTEAAVAHALRLIAVGADILDIGGESTRPGAQPVAQCDQINRVIPVIEQLRARGCARPISIDTTSAAVAKRAIDAGADIINDVSAATDDPEMLPLAASTNCGLILMHRLRPPAQDAYSHDYNTAPDYHADIVDAVTNALIQRKHAALDAGIAQSALVLDPGLGFGKSVAQNFRLMASAGAMQAAVKRPLLIGASRKSFLGVVTDEPDPARRDPQSAAAAAILAQSGVRLFRVHNVAMHAKALSASWRAPESPMEY